MLFGAECSPYMENHSLLEGGGDGPPQGQTTACTKGTRTVLSRQGGACPGPLNWAPLGREPAPQPCEPTLQLEKALPTQATW